eukprot:IDg21547t1
MRNSAQSLTLHQKQLIVKEHDRCRAENRKCSQTDLAQWAQENLKLKKRPNQATISRILKHASEFKALPVHQSKAFKKRRSAAAPRLEEALYKWIRVKSNEDVQIDGPLTVRYAQKLQIEANLQLPADCQLALKFSSGWMENSRSASTSSTAVSTAKPSTRMMQRSRRNGRGSVRDRDVQRAKTCGMRTNSGCFSVNRSVGHCARKNVPAGRNKDKTRLTFLAAATCFDYHSNRKAWMNQILFFAWLQRFDQYIGRKPGRKALLLLDNCSAHGRAESVPPLQNVRLEFLPPRTTAKSSPLTLELLRGLRTITGARLLDRIFENIESGRKSIYNVDILTAMRWAVKEWDDCPATTIRNCFVHCTKLGAENGPGLSEDGNREEVQAEIESLFEEYGMPFSRIGIEALLNPAEENEQVIEETTFEGLVRDVAGVEEPNDGEDAGESAAGVINAEEDGLYSAKEELRVLAIA